MIQHISLIIREIKNVWNNFKNDPNNNHYNSENDLLDLTGYLILLQIMKEDMDANMNWDFNNNVNGKSNEERT